MQEFWQYWKLDTRLWIHKKSYLALTDSQKTPHISPSSVSYGCLCIHVMSILEKNDYFNGTILWYLEKSNITFMVVPQHSFGRIPHALIHSFQGRFPADKTRLSYSPLSLGSEGLPPGQQPLSLHNTALLLAVKYGTHHHRQPAGHACFAQARLILCFGVVCYKEVTFALRVCESSWCHFWLTYLYICLIFSINMVAIRESMFLTSSECNFGQIWTIIDYLVTW